VLDVGSSSVQSVWFVLLCYMLDLGSSSVQSVWFFLLCYALSVGLNPSKPPIVPLSKKLDPL